MNEDMKGYLIIICIGGAITPLFVYLGLDMYDQSKQIDYYTNSIKQHILNETCSDLNASRTIYDPAHKGDLLPSESMVDQAWKEKCS